MVFLLDRINFSKVILDNHESNNYHFYAVIVLALFETAWEVCTKAHPGLVMMQSVIIVVKVQNTK